MGWTLQPYVRKCWIACRAAVAACHAYLQCTTRLLDAYLIAFPRLQVTGEIQGNGRCARPAGERLILDTAFVGADLGVIVTSQFDKVYITASLAVSVAQLASHGHKVQSVQIIYQCDVVRATRIHKMSIMAGHWQSSIHHLQGDAVPYLLDVVQPIYCEECGSVAYDA